MKNDLDIVITERKRIQSEYQRREKAISRDLYAPWQTAEIFMLAARKRMAALMLHQAGVFPKAGDACLEIGYGALGWLGDLITWKIKETDLHGVELDLHRAKCAQEILPLADLRVGDATALPWETDSFRLVIVSTVFTSILDLQVRDMIAKEIQRVLVPGGALLWYDFAVNNPGNPQVRKVSRKDLIELFPNLKGKTRKVTLAPPLARAIAPRSWFLASLLDAIPVLRTHLMAVLIKSKS